ncbi:MULTISPECIES: NAD(P)-dependent oxidoreductase [unclassified Polaribacter]|uniref:NAD(P)-dependent oxidoreductase n=1 Tax=unclassified Polaribacter TaxID=196858 RepID=UPI0011BE550C|nr:MULTISPECIES: NAD(P)-dependent oxidoreductase [unclassified Polaribacter]TXD53335.1 alanine dehydrogenase [Polaribacter sp. IC063]TXD57158.1 alanine dehydrogenase [Polaribacter sp. IC066]
MKFGIIKERKNPPDRRVVFSPEKLNEFQKQFPASEIEVESSDIRVFSDSEYQEKGLKVTNDVSTCDVLFGVKEVPMDALIPNKKYFFFSHTIKKQPYNRDLLKTILDKNIELFDHETIIKENGARLIGFGRYAGIVGAYNGFRAIGLTDETFYLPKAETLDSQKELILALKNIKLGKLKIVLTGNGKVALGAKEMLDAMAIPSVSVTDYLTKNYEHAVYCIADVLDYNKRTDGQTIDNLDFYNHPENYESNFMRFATVTDFFIAGHFYGNGAPYLFTRKDAKSKDFKIKYVADISCDVDGPVASTLRASTIANPIYGYNPQTESEVDYKDENAIVVMAVDNLPCELPKDASEGFGELFLENVIPAFFNSDKDGVLERSKMTENGKLTARFSYLQDYVDGRE